MTTESALQTARTQLRRAVELLELTENDWQTLSTPRRILEVAVPLRRDNGIVEMYKGFRVQYSTTRGPTLICCTNVIKCFEICSCTRDVFDNYTAIITVGCSSSTNASFAHTIWCG